MTIRKRYRKIADFYWRQLSDRKLLEVDFEVVDPDSLDGVVTQLPKNEEEPFIELQYDTKYTTAKKVRCIHCKWENHYKGFVFRYSNGERIFVGIDCGEKLYGARFNQQQSEFLYARDRAKALRARKIVLDRAQELFDEVDILLSHPSLNLFRKVRSNFMKAVPALAKLALNSCQRANGEMYIDLKVRDYAGEAKREERQESIRGRLSTLSKTERGKQRRELANHSPIFRYSSRLLGTIADQPFFRTDVTWPHEQLPALSARLHSLMLQLVVDQPTTAKLQSLLTELNRTLDEAICQIEVLDSLSEAFEAANLSHMVQWATAHDRAGVKYYAMGNKIVRELPEWQNRSLGDLMSVEFPPEFRALDQSRISELRRFFA